MGGRRFRLKPAAVVISARRAETTATWDQVNKYFGLMQMPIVTSQYWNLVHGACLKDVRQDLEGLQTMRTLGNFETGRRKGSPFVALYNDARAKRSKPA
jgi:multimeric flavodoxin WrbA